MSKQATEDTMGELIEYLNAYGPNQRTRPSDDTIVELAHVFFGRLGKLKIAWRIALKAIVG